MTYNCNLCTYSTIYLGDLKKHFTTNKHIYNAQHVQPNDNKNIIPDKYIEIISEKDKEIKKLHEEIKKILTNFVNIQQDDKKNFTKDILESVVKLKSKGNITNNTITGNTINVTQAMKYLIEKFTENKNVLKKVTDEFIDKSLFCKTVNDRSTKISLEERHKAIDRYAESDKDKTLAKKLGKILKYNFKQDDLDLQILWVTDVMRQSFIIKVESSKDPNKVTWIMDKKGEKICEMIITPILNKLYFYTCDYVNYLDKHSIINAKDNEIYKVMKFQEKQNDILKLRENLRHNTLDNTMSYSVLRSCAPYFQLVVEDLDKFLAEKFKKNNRNILDSDSDNDINIDIDIEEPIETTNKAQFKNNQVINQKNTLKEKSIRELVKKDAKKGTKELSKIKKSKYQEKKTTKESDVEIEYSD